MGLQEQKRCLWKHIYYNLRWPLLILKHGDTTVIASPEEMAWAIHTSSGWSWARSGASLVCVCSNILNVPESALNAPFTTETLAVIYPLASPKHVVFPSSTAPFFT